MPKFFPGQDWLQHGGVTRALEELRKTGHVVYTHKRLRECPHEQDNCFLECAETAEAHFLVTGNAKHFPKKWKNAEVLNARALIEFLGTKGSDL
jgi:uncharacterized protein